MAKLPLRASGVGAIEDIVLRRDGRNISSLRPFIADDYCTRAAQLLLDNPGQVLIVTGFYILSGKAIETDGPPGALAIGRALQELGYGVSYVTDSYGAEAMRDLAAGTEVVDFPIADVLESAAFARSLLARLRPSVLVSIERCGASADGLYRNMRGLDISEYTAKVDALFATHASSIGIGDGGNEIGMGNFAEQIPTFEKLPQQPAVATCAEPVIASVSNWGGYGLVAALSQLTGANLLPRIEEEAAWVRRCVELGVVDGTTGDLKPAVDGFTLEENSETLALLHEAVGVV